MLQVIIAILMSLGYLNSPEEWHTLSNEQQIEYKAIIEDELDGI